MISISWLLFVAIVSAVAVLAYRVGSYKQGPPLIDLGHRAYGVADEKTAQLTAQILDSVCGLRERFTFDAGPTHQTLLSDGQTVIMRLSEELRTGSKMTGNALSVVTRNPNEEAKRIVAILKVRGYTAEALPQFDMGRDRHGEPRLVVIQSSAFDHWELVLRRHSFAMGGMPKTRKIS